ncbi:MAG TPA: tetratricopeptide repeat protein [Blastocatellia bacterium]|nr:tetratricopeptide repeat protein [Blastocatellia bacterium]
MFGRKTIATLFLFLVAAVSGWAGAARAQGPVRGPIEEPRDPVLEIAAKHNLEVARYYLTKRKAYEGARDRLQEIVETHPGFSRMDEVLYLLGEANLKLDKPEEAAEYYDKLVKEYPDSDLVKKAKERLDKLKSHSKG